MQRRGFLLSALSAIATTASTSGIAKNIQQPLLLQHSPLAGYQYHAGPQLWTQLAPGQHLNLIREPYNRHDPRAVRIDWNGHKLGYIPRRDNAAVSQLLDRGQPLSARIATLKDSRDPWERIAVEIRLGSIHEIG
jgi:hypothetical protein